MTSTIQPLWSYSTLNFFSPVTVNNTKFTILTDSQDFVVVNKPTGVSMHQEGEQAGIVPQLCQQLNCKHLWLVHRLDKVTSGCLLLAKTSSAASELSQSFAKRLVQKYYLAITSQKPKKRQGSIIGDMQKSRNGKWMLTRERQNPAVTHFFDRGLGGGKRLQLLKPYTGKTHQLRVAMNSMGSSILGDKTYGGLTADRTYLHAWYLQFIFGQERYQIHCQPESGEHFQTPEFQQVLTNSTPPWQHFKWPDDKLNAISARDG